MKEPENNHISAESDSSALRSYAEDGEEAFIDYRWDIALNNFRKVLEIAPDNPRAFQRISEIYAIRGDLNILMEHYSDMARYFISRRRFDEAIEKIRGILRIKPDNYIARLLIAEIYREQDNRDAALSHFLSWGRTFKRSHMPEEALLFLQNAYEIAPHDLGIAQEIAEIFFEIKHPAQAAKFYKALAVECLKKGLQMEARMAFKTSQNLELQRRPKTGIDTVSFALEDECSGEELFKGILMIDYDEIVVLKRLGKRLEEKGDLEEALRIYGEVLNLDPDDLDTKEILGELNIHLNNMQSALKYYLMAAEDYYSRGEKEKAKKLYSEVLEIEPEHQIAKHKLEEMGAK